MNEFQYRTLRAYAHSDLCELFNLRMGHPLRPIAPAAAQFGRTFHQLILEPDKDVDWERHHVTEHAKLLKMAQSFRTFIGEWYRSNPLPWERTEQVYQRTCPITGLPLKAKVDAITQAAKDPRKIVIDLKTTSCRTSVEFFDTIRKYGYDRQGAYYLDLAGLPTSYDFHFMAIQKVKPFDVFFVNMAISQDRRDMIDRAREKNARLLRDALAESQKPNGWRPSSWSRKEAEV